MSNNNNNKTAERDGKSLYVRIIRRGEEREVRLYTMGMDRDYSCVVKRVKVRSRQGQGKEVQDEKDQFYNKCNGEAIESL